MFHDFLIVGVIFFRSRMAPRDRVVVFLNTGTRKLTARRAISQRPPGSAGSWGGEASGRIGSVGAIALEGVFVDAGNVQGCRNSCFAKIIALILLE